MRGSEETPSGSQAGPFNTSRKSIPRTAAGGENRKPNGCGALPTPQLVKIDQVAELLSDPKKPRRDVPGRLTCKRTVLPVDGAGRRALLPSCRDLHAFFRKGKRGRRWFLGVVLYSCNLQRRRAAHMPMSVASPMPSPYKRGAYLIEVA